MSQPINEPYVKTYDKNGTLTNPIVGIYETKFANRRARHEQFKVKPLYGCGKNFPLTVTPTAKFLRRKQFILMKDGSIKIIIHYDLRNRIS